MKKQITISIVAISLASNLSASNLFGDFVPKVTQGSQFNLSGDALKDKATSFLDTKADSFMKDMTKQATSSIAAYAGGALKGITGNSLDYCYTYKPKKKGEFGFSLNPCDFFKGANPCKLAPNLSSMGFYKKPLDVEKDFAIIKYLCDASSVKVDEKKVKSVIKAYSDDDVLAQETQKNITQDADAEKPTAKAKTKQETREETDKILSLDNLQKNKAIRDVMQGNDYKSAVIIKNIIKSSNTEELDGDAANLDLSNFNIKDATLKEYEESIDKMTIQISSVEKSLDINYIKRTAIKEFDNVNNSTSDETEREQQKEAIKQNLLKTLKQSLSLKEAMEISRLDYKVDEKNQIAYPTKEYVGRGTTPQDRLKLAYHISKQKVLKAEAQAQIKIENEKLYSEAENAIEAAKINSRLFNRAAALATLKAELGL